MHTVYLYSLSNKTTLNIDDRRHTNKSIANMITLREPDSNPGKDKLLQSQLPQSYS